MMFEGSRTKAALRSCGNLFQAEGPAYEKDHAHNLVQVLLLRRGLETMMEATVRYVSVDSCGV